jgi:DNA-binding NarL/FixJ family response regulator
MNSRKYKIALADDHPLIRRGLVELINSYDNYEVLFDVANGQDLIDRIVGAAVPDFVILDVKMPRKDGYETAAWLMTTYPDIRVLALSMDDEEAAILRMLKNGARGYIFKDADPGELKEALDTILIRGYHLPVKTPRNPYG